MAQSETEDANKKKRSYTFFVGVCIASLVVLVWWSFWCDRKETDDPSSYLNALFAGLAFVGLIVAILLQKEELELQRKELGDTREVFKIQRFENSFFNLFNAHVAIVKDMDVRSKGVVVNQGRDCFKTFYKYFRELMIKKMKTDYYANNKGGVFTEEMEKTITLDFETVLGYYMETYNEYQGDLGHYFRSLYHLIKFVIEADDNIGLDKKKYITLVRAQLSSYELVILFYNGLGKYGKPQFAKVYAEHHLLKNLDWELLISKDHTEKYINDPSINYIKLKPKRG